MRDDIKFSEMPLPGQIITIGICGALIFGAYTTLNREAKQKIAKLEPGYPIPHKVRVNYSDLDGNGRYETRVLYNNKGYLLKLDKNKNLVLEAYRITPEKK